MGGPMCSRLSTRRRTKASSGPSSRLLEDRDGPQSADARRSDPLQRRRNAVACRKGSFQRLARGRQGGETEGAGGRDHGVSVARQTGAIIVRGWLSGEPLGELSGEPIEQRRDLLPTDKLDQAIVNRLIERQ